jgi:hypothetical protein
VPKLEAIRDRLKVKVTKMKNARAKQQLERRIERLEKLIAEIKAKCP